jgi:hypothetical protein
MRSTLLAAGLYAFACILPHSAAAQDRQPDPPAVRLELTMEIATTTDNGLPAALRFTLTNIGSVAVDLPHPSISCPGSPVGDIRIETVIHFDGKEGAVGGYGCGGSYVHDLSFVAEIKRNWFHLRPGEYLVFTGDRRTMITKASEPATYEYHAVYAPPLLTPEQRNLAAQAGYIIPTETVESDPMQYHEN